MKVTRPQREVEVCDHCQREGFLQTCPVCGGQFCLTCRAIIAGCWVDPKVCRKCGERSDVEVVVARYAERITPIIKERLAALADLPREMPQRGADDDDAGCPLPTATGRE